jgi:hypothetical protein
VSIDGLWDIIPGDRIGPLALGMTEAELTSAWARVPETWKDDSMSPGYWFADDGRCTRIWIMLDQPVPVVLFGRDLRDLDEDTFDAVLAELGPLVGGYGSIEVPSAGIGGVKWERSDARYVSVHVMLATEA